MRIAFRQTAQPLKWVSDVTRPSQLYYTVHWEKMESARILLNWSVSLLTSCFIVFKPSLFRDWPIMVSPGTIPYFYTWIVKGDLVCQSYQYSFYLKSIFWHWNCLSSVTLRMARRTWIELKNNGQCFLVKYVWYLLHNLFRSISCMGKATLTQS